jgi:hypothetical protein
VTAPQGLTRVTLNAQSQKPQADHNQKKYFEKSRYLVAPKPSDLPLPLWEAVRSQWPFWFDLKLMKSKGHAKWESVE